MRTHLTSLLLLATALQPDAILAATQDLYQQHCAACHGTERLGGTGPALLPQNLSRLRSSAAIEVITQGRALTQMPAFGEQLSPDEISALTDYIYQAPRNVPKWGLAEIRASHIVHHAPGSLGDKPVFDADLQNLFIVVELGDHHATILDGDKFEAIHRFKTRYALHGGPKYTSDGRYVFFASRDGWISKFDMYNLEIVAEIRAGINTRNAAVSFNNCSPANSTAAAAGEKSKPTVYVLIV